LVTAFLCLTIALVFGRSVRGEEASLQIFYRLNPPLIVKQDGHPSGFVYEFMKYVLVDKLKLAASPDQFSEVPLARGLHSIEFNNTALFFNVISTPDREQKYKLIKIPGIFERTYLYSRKDKNIKLEKIVDAAKYNVGVVNGSSSLDFIKKNIGDSLRYEVALTHENNLNKLLSGRVDLIAAPEYSIDYISESGDIRPKLVKSLFLEKNDFYIAVNKEFDEELLHNIQKAVIDASTEPIYNDLLIKYKESIQY